MEKIIIKNIGTKDYDLFYHELCSLVAKHCTSFEIKEKKKANPHEQMVKQHFGEGENIKWISDRLPERCGVANSSFSDYVLGYADGHFYGEAIYNHFSKCWYNKNIYEKIKITHWCPRTKPK